MHRGLPNTCEKCHGTRGWKPASFDHNLLSASARASCQNCHLSAGQRAHPGRSTHRTSGWKPSTWQHPRVQDLNEHVKKVGCRGCHQSGWRQAQACEVCHTNGIPD